MVETASQGRHADPAENAADARWEDPARDETLDSTEMATYRASLTVDGLDARESVLEELSAFHGYSPDECLKRCLHWEEWSVEEWDAADRSTPEGVRDFYNSVQSWSFDLMWYAYLQSVGNGYPAAVVSARFADQHTSGRDFLDFGSGTGTTAQLFARLGYTTTMADVSAPLLEYAAWRLARHGDQATIIDLNTERLPDDSYDFITALDTLVHVTDFDATARDLRRAIRSGGYLLANFDVRNPDDQGAQWHLYEDEHGIDHRLRAAGFEYVETLCGVTRCYRAVDPDRASFKLAMSANAALVPARKAKDRARTAARTLRRKLRRNT
jgi:SAM-dependent methyltransferase